MSWRRQLRDWTARTTRQGREHIHRVAVQGYQRARLSGAKLAAKVVSIQRAARLEPKLMMRSVTTVAGRDMARLPDAVWRDGYADKARSLITPPPPAPEPPARPAWPHIGRSDREAGQ